MQENDTTTVPPMTLIRWWFSKTEEEREKFLQDPTVSEKARQNIPLVEKYVRQHCYLVACETNLDIYPIPSFSSRLRRGLERKSGGYGVWLPCVMHGEKRTYGGRYIAASQREKWRMSAHRLFRDVCTRTAVVLHDYSVYSSPVRSLLSNEERWCHRAAYTIVEALMEASVAALYRLGLIDALEKIEKEMAQDAENYSNGQMIKDGTIVPKPIGVRRAETHGCLGVWMLLLPTAIGKGETVSLPMPNTMQNRKRSRNTDTENGFQTPLQLQQRSLPFDTEVNCWQLLREQIASSSTDGLRHESNVDRDDEDDVAVMVPHSEPRITITAADMRFGIAKALKNRGRQST
ncbi:hypothetical protein MOQ_005241 [Trypanosoma cruzi marinkellei]|uniref:Uncharacterized protein n=1 Tax=Trypanosoma cruzi marinkellei TaxID=85056 RepID=K2MYR1_TRYCR|nr:hypothetical protein MOQ_005241 [Trypanosoma cruzi marinkellei]